MSIAEKSGSLSTRLTGLALAGLCLTACGKDVQLKPDKPITVVSHEHTDAYIAFMHTCASYDKNGSCMVPIDMPYEVPENFVLHVKQCSNPNKDTDCQTDDLGVNSQEYDDYPDGSVIYVDKDEHILR